MTLLEILKRLCACKGGAGEESPVAAEIKKMLAPYGEAKTDPLGNLTLTLGSGERKILLDAHIDQISLVVTDIDESGFVRAANCGGIDRRTLMGHRLTLIGKKTLTGVVCSVPPHLQKSSDRKVPPLEELAVDLGLSGPALLDAVSLGDRLYYEGPFLELLHDRVCAPSLDNRAGAAILIAALEKIDLTALPCTLTLLFSTREETGEQGAAVSGFSSAPDEALIVDVSFACAPGIPNAKAAPLEGGAMVGFAASLDRRISDRLMALGQEKNIPVQREIMGGTTGTNADALSVSGRGVPSCTVSVPIRNMHTPVETAALCDLESAAALLADYMMGGGVGGL